MIEVLIYDHKIYERWRMRKPASFYRENNIKGQRKKKGFRLKMGKNLDNKIICIKMKSKNLYRFFFSWRWRDIKMLKRFFILITKL